MQAVIVAGGKGTRLRPLTYQTPKPMLPIFERPFLCLLVERCRAAGIVDILMNVHYQAGQIQDYFGDGGAFGVRIRYSIEQNPLDTAGAVKLAEPYFTGAPLVVFNADILTDLDLKALLAAHREAGAVATLALTRVLDPTAFGLVQLSEHHRVVAFREKPTAEEADRLGSDTVNAGTYVLEPRIFAAVPKQTPWSFERQLFPDLLAQRQQVLGFVSDAYWLDIGNPAKYWQAHVDILSGRMPYPPQAQQTAPGIWVAEGAAVDPAARLEAPCYIGGRCCVGPEAAIAPGTVLGSASLVNRPLAPGIYPPGTMVP
ncbi:MAG: NDP-sugar synthase [Aphanocapsa lilacina HA4352-LM1]|nr:NDP-sugar synthase [Aphanocapsa lilacina HA4352-LM1]